MCSTGALGLKQQLTRMKISSDKYFLQVRASKLETSQCSKGNLVNTREKFSITIKSINLVSMLYQV